MTSSTSGASGTTSSSINPFAQLTTNNSSGAPVSFGGVVSGMNTQSIINALMVAYQQPQTNIANQISQINSNITDYQTIQNDLTSLQSAADSINQTYLWDQTSVASSNSSIATASAAPGTPSGTVSFTVNQLAQGNVLMSNTPVSSTNAIVASGPLLLAEGAASLGFASLGAGSGLTVGSHSVAVTSALSGATISGTPVAPTTTITTGSNDTFSATINGTAKSFTLAAGTYTQSQLASALQSASGGLLNVAAGSNGGLTVSTASLGSSSSLAITGGTALSALGLTANATAVNGTAGSITVDGTVNTVDNVAAGSAVTLNSGTGGTITTTVGTTGFSTGNFTANYLNVNSGSLSDVANAINGASIGITASAVNLGSSQYVLELSSGTTGTQSQISVDTSALSSSLGGLKQVAAAQDAQIQIGGSGGYTVSSQTNQITGVMQGLTINLVSAQASGSQPVTLSLSPDAQAMASSVSTMVKAANQVLGDINTYAGYNATTAVAGPLMADPNMQLLTQQVLATVASAVGGTGGSLNSASVGLNVTKDGMLTFDANAFMTAYQQNPTQVSQMFSQGGAFSPSSSSYGGSVSFLFANDGAVPGTYAVSVSQSATQAADKGSVLASGNITAAEQLTVASGGVSGTYSATAGESLSNIASGLNSIFASNGMNVLASVATSSSGSQLVINSGTYGSAASFSVTSNNVGSGQTGLATTANTASSFSGTDVAGTINGVAATGTGQVLMAPQSDPKLAGMALLVTATGISSTTNMGTISYTPGIAGGLASAANGGSNPVSGSMTSTIGNLNQQIQSLQFQYNSYTPMIQAEQTLLQQEYSNVEVQLGSLQSQSNWLSAQLSKLP
ncbi:MAG: flagellar filament capping protein FliD [Actinomycetota bacterium]|nr:flagellar filament capping protein FliD [Actinomycetota bacterium]